MPRSHLQPQVSPFTGRLRAPLLLLLALGVIASMLTSAATPPSGAATGSDRFWAGEVYRGEFGAPTLLKVGGTYYAYATNTDGNNLPLLTSTDLVTWRARQAWPVGTSFSTWKGYNDAMPFPASRSAGASPPRSPGTASRRCSRASR